MIRTEEVYRIGRIGKPHGVGGEVSFHFDDDVFDRTDAEYLVLSVEGILVPFFMESYRFHGSATALVKFCDIDTQEQARTLTGCDVFFPRRDDNDTADGLSFAEIVGYTIVDAASRQHIGKIQAVDDSTINTLFDIATPDGGSVLIPASDDLIAYIDTATHTIAMTLPEGLFDL